VTYSPLLWKTYGLEPATEFRFHPVRRWRFDYAFVSEKIAVEIEGGIWIRGAHTRGGHFLSDAEKYNTAIALGWRVFRFTPQQLRKGEAQEFIKKILEAK